MYSYVKFVLSQVCFLLLIWASSFPKFDSYFFYLLKSVLSWSYDDFNFFLFVFFWDNFRK